MKHLYFECAMGASGDMLMSALLELLDDPDDFVAQLNAIGLEGVSVSRTNVVKNGISGTHVDVTFKGRYEDQHEHVHGDNHENQHEHEGHNKHSHHHKTRNLSDVLEIIGGLAIPERVRDKAEQVYTLIADAESKVHGEPVTELHFHELGMMDAICDITGVCLLIDRLSPDIITASPVNTGSGMVRSAHGLIPVPAPATSLLLRGIPTYSGEIKSELCTPTGAALLKVFASDFGPMPQIGVKKIGYGMGTKDFAALNCVRAFWGDTEETYDGPNGEVTELVCNLDDMTGEAIGFALEELLSAGALDVFTIPIQMKKNRPGVMLVCLCGRNRADYFAALMLKHTTSFGVRRRDCVRYELDREITVNHTELGDVRIKTGTGYGVVKSKTEYEDAAAIARASGKPIDLA